MRIIRFPDANKTDIIAPSDTIEEVVDKWKCNGNPNVIVHLYAYLPPYFFPSRSDGSVAETTSSAISSEEVYPISLRERGSSDFLEEDD